MQPVRAPYEAPTRTRGRPAVIAWYRVYAATMPLLYVFGLVLWHAVIGRTASVNDLLYGAGVVAGLTSFFVASALVPYKPWGWTLGLLAIGLGLVTCLAPAAIALLFFWMRPETKAAFCRL